MNNNESILNKVTRILSESENESMFRTGPMDGDSGLDHPSTSLHQTCECSIYTMNIFLSNLAMRTYPDPETPIFQIKTKLNTVGHYDFDARAVTRWMRQIDPNMGSDVYSAPLKQFGGRFGVLDNNYTVGEDDGLESKLGYGLQLTFHVDKTPQGYGIIARMEKVFNEPDIIPEDVVEEEIVPKKKIAKKHKKMTEENRHNLNKNEEFTVVVTKNNKVIDQLAYVMGSEVDAAIDLYKEMHGKDAIVSIENKSGKIVYTESKQLKEEMSIPQQHQFKIAKKTLKMSDSGARIMGGMSKDKAREFLKTIAKWSDERIKKYENE